MKLMFVSDIHGKLDYLDILLNIYYKEKPDNIIFLGDLFSFYVKDEVEELINKIRNKVVIKGNCDSETDVLTSNLNFTNDYYFEAFNKKFYCSHGNIYNINRFPPCDFDCLVYGHTHQGLIHKEYDKYFLNPGSFSYPRGGSVNSYMIIDDTGIILKDLDQKTIEKISW